MEKTKRVRRKSKAGAAFGNVLREIRVAKGWTQEDLAYETRLERTYISLLERGRGQPTLSVILEIANCTGISAPELIRKVVEALDTTKR